MSLIQATPAAPTEATPLSPGDSLWLYALFALLATAGFFYVNIMSAIVDGLVTGLGFSNAEAGVVGSANIYGASFGSLIAVFIVRHLPWRRTLFTLLCLLLCIDLASIAIDQVTLLTAVRAVHGLIGGMAVGVTYSAMARTRSPDRAFGMLLMVQFGLGGLGVMFLPGLVPEYGARVLFLVLAGVTTAALLATFAIPPINARERTQDNATYPPLERRRRLTAGFTLLAMFLFQAGNMALAAFIIGLGEHFGLKRDFIS
ncbi:MAG: MFS transporter, partial [Pseudomonadota bacterium]|nr:MFS transporter [Pseudomonadota bacterium]